MTIPFKGDLVSNQVKTKVKAALNRTYFAAALKVTFNIKTLPTPPIKERLPKMSSSNIIYLYTCSTCRSTYCGRTTRLLSIRAREHFNLNACLNSKGEFKSALAQHLVETGHACNFETDFMVVKRAKHSFQLNTLEAAAIHKLRPSLCKQATHVKAL